MDRHTCVCVVDDLLQSYLQMLFTNCFVPTAFAYIAHVRQYYIFVCARAYIYARMNTHILINLFAKSAHIHEYNINVYAQIRHICTNT